MAQEENVAASVTRVQWNSAADPDFEIPAPPTGEPPTDATVAHVGASASTAEASTDAPAEAQAEPEAESQATEEVLAEEKPAEESKPPAETNSQRLERLARYEARLRADRQRARAEAEQYQAKLAELRQFDEQLKSLRSNPIEAAKFLGLDPRELLRATLGEEAPPKSPEEQIREELEQLKAWRAERERLEVESRQRAEAEEKQRRQQEGLGNILRAAEEGCKASGDEFELINARGAYQLVVDTQIAYFQAHKAPIDWRTAAKAVEADLEAEATQYLSTKKISQRVKPAAAAEPKAAAQATTSPAAIPGSKTITARPVAVDRNAPERVVMPSRYVDRDESIESIAAQLAAANRAR